MDRGTMEVSSTTTTSWRSGLDRSCRNRVRLPPARPRSRCSVMPRRPRSRSTVPGSRPSRVASSRTASSSRRDALPVGAAKAMSGGVAPRATACWSSNPNSRATVVVLPVPGPPAITETRRRTAVAAANGCRWSGSSASGSSSRNNVVRPARSSAMSTSITSLAGPAQELCRHLPLVEPEAIQVQVRPRQPERLAVPDKLGSGSARRATSPGRARATRPGRSAGRCPCWRSGGSSAGRRTRGRAAAPGRRRRSRATTASSSVPASCAKRCAMWTSALSRSPAWLKARKLPDAPAANEAS